MAEEIKDAGRVLPLGMILSLLLVRVFYMLVIFVTIGVLDKDALIHSLTPIPDAASYFAGTWGKAVLSIVALLAFISAANAGILGASRYPLALSRDNMLPEIFGRVSERFKTPHVAIVITGIFIILALFLNLDILIKAASSVLILTYVFACLAVIILRESHIQNYQPAFHTPLYPWLQIFGIIGFGILLAGIGMDALFVNGILVAGGLFVYWFCGRIRSTREYALLHLIERITAREFTTHLLETELKEIIRERDDLLKDRFDHLVESCPVMDIEGPLTMEEFFRLTAGEMAADLQIHPDTLFTLLLDREKESSTVLSPGLAIPHIVIKGNHTFNILFARCRQGIDFHDVAHHVHTVFVLAGSRDERPFHLQSLAAIAQIVQDQNFERRWMSAKNKHALRDLILLGKQRRH